MRKIYYFTNSYPYDIGEEWKTNELLGLRNFFEITVIPYHSNTKKIAASFIEDIKYFDPLFCDFKYTSLKNRFFRIIFSKFFFLFIEQFLTKKVFFNKARFFSWISASHKILLLSKNKILSEIIKNSKKDDIFYFFWGKETSEIIPILPNNFLPKIVVRFHGYDLYEERNNNYIPYRKKQLLKIDTAAFISKQGKEYLEKKYPKIKFNAKIFRLGTTYSGKSLPSNDNVFRIFSCSSLIPLKRVDLLAEAVIKLNFSVEWTHIGSGEMLFEIEKILKRKPTNIKIIFTGQVKSDKVKSYYVNKFADVFINVSTTEGVPVSVMEAMSAGLPVLATNVGGTSEIVDDENGKLLDPNLNSDILASELTTFYSLSTKEKSEKRIKSFEKFLSICDADILATKLSEYLQNI